MKGRPLHQRIGFALAGWRTGWARERSFRTQVFFAVAAFAVLVALRPAPVWWAVVAVTVALVLSLEMLNSAVEGLTDLLHPEIHPEVKAIKDRLAGAVLAISSAAAIVAAALVVDHFGLLR